MKKQKPVRDLFWVEVEKEQEDTIKINGKELYLDSSYNALFHARQHGKVYQTPVHDKLELDIKKGDIVYFHHFVTADEETTYGTEKGVNRVDFIKDKKVYKVHNSQIYGRTRKGKFKAVHHWNFVEQLKEDEESIKTESGIYFKPDVEDIRLYGRLIHPSKELKHIQGEKIIFSENSEYKMDIEGEELMRMRNQDILAVYKD